MVNLAIIMLGRVALGLTGPFDDIVQPGSSRMRVRFINSLGLVPVQFLRPEQPRFTRVIVP